MVDSQDEVEKKFRVVEKAAPATDFSKANPPPTSCFPSGNAGEFMRRLVLPAVGE
jgi:hypothetical protein